MLKSLVLLALAFLSVLPSGYSYDGHFTFAAESGGSVFARAAGNPADIVFGGGKLSSRQTGLLAQLPEVGSSVVVRKSGASLRDLAAMTAQTGDEFAMFTRGSQRMLVRGQGPMLPTVSVDFAESMAAQGWRWSGHTHPGFMSIMPSAGDAAVLNAFGQGRSVIYSATGRFQVFGPP